MRAIRNMVSGFLLGIAGVICIVALLFLGYLLSNYVLAPLAWWYCSALMLAGPVAVTLGIAGPVLGVLLLGEWLMKQYQRWFG